MFEYTTPLNETLAAAEPTKYCAMRSCIYTLPVQQLVWLCSSFSKSSSFPYICHRTHMHLSLKVLLTPTLLPASLRPPACTGVSGNRGACVIVFFGSPSSTTPLCYRCMRFRNRCSSSSISFSIIGSFTGKVLRPKCDLVRIRGRRRR